MAAIPLKISDLIMDTENPRLRGPEGQRESLQQMVADQKDRLSNLAEHISAMGMNPLDRMMVMKSESDPSKFVALEGNRRVAALKILTNPAVLSGIHISEKEKKKFVRLAAEFKRSKVEPIDAFEVKTRAESRPWIELRHTGANAGRGLVSWESIQAARFRGEDTAGIQAIEFVKQYGDLSDDEIVSLDKGFPITTLDRLMKSRVVRERVGLSLNKGKLEANIPGPQILKPLKKMVLDLAKVGLCNVLFEPHKSLRYFGRRCDRRAGPDRPVEN